MGVLIIGAALAAAVLGAGWWVAKAPRGPGDVLGIAAGVLTGTFLMQLTPPRPRPRPARPHRPARDVAAPAAADAGPRTRPPAPAGPAAAPSHQERVPAHR